MKTKETQFEARKVAALMKIFLFWLAIFDI